MQEQLIIERISHQYIDAVIQFEIGLAKETENMDLSPEIVQQSITFVANNPQAVISLIAKIDGKAVGGIMAVYENQEKSWITSVYVTAKHRQRGIFKRLFHKCCEMERQKGQKQILLYLRKQNERALKTYSRLGMTLVEDTDMFGYQFVYNNDALPEVNGQYKIESKQQIVDNSFLDILKLPCKGNNPLCIFKQDQLIGYAQYYEQFTQWRFGRHINITQLLLKQENQKDAIACLLKHLKENLQGLQICTIRFIASSNSNLKQLIQIPQLKYNIMQIIL